MNVEIRIEAAQSPEKKYTNGIFVAVRIAVWSRLILDPASFILSTTAAKLFLACISMCWWSSVLAILGSIVLDVFGPQPGDISRFYLSHTRGMHEVADFFTVSSLK